jgi:hypothetical protein
MELVFNPDDLFLFMYENINRECLSKSFSMLKSFLQKFLLPSCGQQKMPTIPPLNMDYRTNKEIWRENLARAKNFLDAYFKRPSENSVAAEEKRLAKWLDHQIQNYRKRERILSHEDIRTEWESFFFSPEYGSYFANIEAVWFGVLAEVKGFIDATGRLPSEHSDDPEESGYGYWLSLHLKNYRRQVNLLARPDIRAAFEELMHDPCFSIST